MKKWGTAWLRQRDRLSVRSVAGIAAAVLFVAFGVARCARDDGGSGSDGPFFATVKGPLTISVTESGTVKPSEQEIIKCELEGRTTILYLIPEGTRVKKGELLVELDASKLEDSKVDQDIRVQNAKAAFIQSRENLEVVKNQAQSDIDKAELTLRFAKEDLEQYREGLFPNELKEQEARIVLAKEELQRAQEQVKWSKVLFGEKYLAESELQADELAAKKAALDVDLATNKLTLLKEFTYKRNVAQLESDVKQAEMALERTKRKASANVVQAETDLRAKESEFKRQNEKFKKIKDQISKARITAPRDGLVVYATSTQFRWRGNSEPLDEGQEVRERQELIHLPTASTFKAEVKVHESNLDKIRLGLPVRITVDAIPGREFVGRVSFVAPLPDPTSMFMNPDLKVYNMEITIRGGGDVLRTGMSCNADIIVEHYDSALYIPVQAVTRIGGRPTAFVRKRSGTEPRSVEIGLDNNSMVLVLGGLEEGEEVLLTPPLDVEGVVLGAQSKPLAPELMPAAEPSKVGPSPSPASAGSRRSDKQRTPDAVPGEPGVPGERRKAPERSGKMTSEQRRKMRERFEKMTPEQREEFRSRRSERGRERDRN